MQSFAEVGRHAVDFLPAVDAMCRAHGVTPADIGQVFVSAGPGSFTGLRIGITAARMIALAVGARLVGVPTLEVIAQNAADQAEPPGRVVVMIDAKRNRVYAATFVRGEVARAKGSVANRSSAVGSVSNRSNVGPVSNDVGPVSNRSSAVGSVSNRSSAVGPASNDVGPVSNRSNTRVANPSEPLYVPEVPDAILPPGSVAPAVEADPARYLADCGADCAVLGEGVAVHRSAVQASGVMVLPERLYPARVRTVYRLGYARAVRGQFADPRSLVPIYVRPPEAEEKWQQRQQDRGT